MKIETALISVSDKTGVVDLARRLGRQGIVILSTGGTARFLGEAGVETVAVSRRTGFPEILDGRVKTLHPKIHGGILARLDDPEHQRQLAEHGIGPIGLVVVNLYPFSKTASRSDAGFDEVVEQIDIGGPCLIRAAAKNFAWATALTDPDDYLEVAAEIQVSHGETSLLTRRKLALKAFQHTAAYDLAIAEYLENQAAAGEEGPPAAVCLSLERVRPLRYGENPHQRAALYRPRFQPAGGVAAARQIQGKELSFNNYVDLEAAWDLSREFDDPFCAVIKHTNPCGAAVADTLEEAYRLALEADPVSAFGSIIAVNRVVDGATAERMKSLFVEAIIAPGYQEDALRIFEAKKNLRVMELPPDREIGRELDFKRIGGGFLIQESDRFFVRQSDLKSVTKRIPDKGEIRDLLFAWGVCKHVKSNAIVLARGGRTLGVGAGQMSRIDAVELAVAKAKGSPHGAVLASDAFFRFGTVWKRRQRLEWGRSSSPAARFATLRSSKPPTGTAWPWSSLGFGISSTDSSFSRRGENRGNVVGHRHRKHEHRVGWLRGQ